MPTLRGSKNFYEFTSISDILAFNLKEQYEYGLLEKGAYTACEFSNTATSGFTKLKRIHDNRYTDGQVYEGIGPSWVWQTGVSVPNGFTQPFQVSGVYIDKTFYPVGTSGQNSFTIDYQFGRVIFDNAKDSNTEIEAEYVINDIALYLSDDPRWKTFIDEYIDKFADASDLAPSGLSVYLKEKRVWLPCLVIEIDELNETTGLQLGGGEIQDFAVQYHIFAEQPFVRNRLGDLVSDQFNSTINLYEINSSTYPFDFDGSLASGVLEYPQLAKRHETHYFTDARVGSVKGGSVGNLVDLYRGEYRNIIEVDRYLSTY